MDYQLICPLCGGDLIIKDGWRVCVKGDYQRQIEKGESE